jgi:Bacterial Ig-like domain
MKVTVFGFVVVAATVVACKPACTVQCLDDSNCDLAAGGACLANPTTRHRWCGYPATDCPSGVRWSDLDVGDGVSGRCVDPLALDKTPPAVIGRMPAPDSQAISPTTLIMATFSEPIKPESVTPTSFLLEDQGGNTIEATFASSGNDVVATPKVPLDPHLDYRITLTQSITDLAGNSIPESANWGFRTSDASWSAPLPLEQEQSKSAISLATAASNGVVVAAWTTAPCVGTVCASASEVWASVRKGGVWGSPKLLASSTERLGPPKVAVARSGHAIVLWGQGGVSTAGSIYNSRYNGSAWSQAVPVVNDLDRLLDIDQVEVDPVGNVLVIWFDRMLPSTYRIWVSRFDLDIGWNQPHLLGGSANGNRGVTSIALTESTALASWFEVESMQLFVSRFIAGAWTSPAVVANATVVPKLISVAAFGADATVVWATDHLYARGFVNQSWGTILPLDKQTSPVPIDVLGSRHNISYVSSGSAVTVWSTANNIWQAIRAPNQAWGPSLQIDIDAQPIKDLDVSVGRRRALAMWRTADLSANEYNQATGWRGAGLVESQSFAISGFSAVYDDTKNAFVAVWLQGNAAGLVDVVSSTFR